MRPPRKASMQNEGNKPSGFLVLSRQCDEDILVGDNIVVRIVDIRGDRVRVGISAPASVRVDRREVRERIDRGEVR